jgi:thymidylate synthase (FAD)
MEISVLDHGFVRLDAAQADDLSVVNSARVSFNKRSDQIGEAEIGLINYLLKNKHGTPFESNFFRFHIKAPIFVVREWMRHRIGNSYNEWSARYSELKEEFYIPDLKNVRKQVGKPGHYKFDDVDIDTAEEFCDNLRQFCKRAYIEYKRAINHGVAKELARLFLPVNIYSEFYFSTNARALMNFLSLRNSEQAQREIRQYAVALESIFESSMPVTYQAFIKNGRIAP